MTEITITLNGMEMMEIPEVNRLATLFHFAKSVRTEGEWPNERHIFTFNERSIKAGVFRSVPADDDAEEETAAADQE